MDDNGWFVSLLMYAGIIISALIIKPTVVFLRVLRWFALRFPRLSLAAVWGACLSLVVWASAIGTIPTPFMTVTLIVVVLGGAGMMAAIWPANFPERERIDHKNIPKDDWFSERELA
jgi:hypothetical protein